MKLILILVSICTVLHFSAARAQMVKDPLLDYYHTIKSGDTLGDDEPHYSPQTRIYCFKADLTGDGHKSVFITDDESRQGPHGLYGWFVYYPLPSGCYQKIDDGISMWRGGPDYIGYVDQIKSFGIVMGSKDGVGVYIFENNKIDSKMIDEERGHAAPSVFPKYFHDHLPDYHIATITLGQLTQKYGHTQ